MKIKVFYSDKLSVDQGKQGFGNIIKSPSAQKPKLLADLLMTNQYVEFIDPCPLNRDDFYEAHDRNYVDNIFDLKEDNGFGNRSKEVSESLCYTNGAMYDAARFATIDNPTCALVSGFHHAGFDRWKGLGYFCTFNGLAIAAIKLAKQGKKVVILDCDMHEGNGTTDILNKFSDLPILHFTYGALYNKANQAKSYLYSLSKNGHTRSMISNFKPDLIIYQAGADVHINDPYGGLFDDEEIYQRDKYVFELSRDLSIPIAWDLAGGYQIDDNNSPKKVLDIHLNTFKACVDVYGV